MEVRIADSEKICGVLSLIAAMKWLLPVHWGFSAALKETASHTV